MTAKNDLLDPILDRMAADGLFHLVLVSGHRPHFQVDFSAQPVLDTEPMDFPTLEGILHEAAGDQAWAAYRQSVESGNSRTGVGFDLRHSDLRFRVHITGGQDRLTAVFRRINGLP